MVEVKIDHREVTAHEVTAHAVNKMDGGCIGWRWSCSCGRERWGVHRTPSKAVEAGQAHKESRPSGYTLGGSVKDDPAADKFRQESDQIGESRD